ncbi:MAG TPA: helix-turn-helix transcriptional regulator [Methylomirabilota bacterium]|nr:helix-turn-helix transcriptional regulator [Methylomirabilota bacterium]
MAGRSEANINIRVGRNLRMIRLRKRLMQIDVAVATDLHRTYISKIETGKARITLDLLRKLVRGLEVTPKELMEGKDLALAQQTVYKT